MTVWCDSLKVFKPVDNWEWTDLRVTTFGAPWINATEWMFIGVKKKKRNLEISRYLGLPRQGIWDTWSHPSPKFEGCRSKNHWWWWPRNRKVSELVGHLCSFLNGIIICSFRIPPQRRTYRLPGRFRHSSNSAAADAMGTHVESAISDEGKKNWSNPPSRRNHQ